MALAIDAHVAGLDADDGTLVVRHLDGLIAPFAAHRGVAQQLADIEPRLVFRGFLVGQILAVLVALDLVSGPELK